MAYSFYSSSYYDTTVDYQSQTGIIKKSTKYDSIGGVAANVVRVDLYYGYFYGGKISYTSNSNFKDLQDYKFKTTQLTGQDWISIEEQDSYIKWVGDNATVSPVTKEYYYQNKLGGLITDPLNYKVKLNYTGKKRTANFRVDVVHRETGEVLDSMEYTFTQSAYSINDLIFFSGSQNTVGDNQHLEVNYKSGYECLYINKQLTVDEIETNVDWCGKTEPWSNYDTKSLKYSWNINYTKETRTAETTVYATTIDGDKLIQKLYVNQTGTQVGSFINLKSKSVQKDYQEKRESRSNFISSLSYCTFDRFETDVNWCRGDNGYLEYDTNYTPNERTCTVTVYATGENGESISDTFTLTQSGTTIDSFISVTNKNTSYNSTTYSGTSLYTLNYCTFDHIEITPNIDWCQYKDDNLRVSYNYTLNERTCTVTVYATGTNGESISNSFTLTQSGKNNYFSSTTDPVYIQYNTRSVTKTLNLLTNVEVIGVESDSDWAHPYWLPDNKQIYVSTDINNTGEDRISKITVKLNTPDGEVELSFNIYQYKSITVNVNPTTYTVDWNFVGDINTNVTFVNTTFNRFVAPEDNPFTCELVGDRFYVRGINKNNDTFEDKTYVFTIYATENDNPENEISCTFTFIIKGLPIPVFNLNSYEALPYTDGTYEIGYTIENGSVTFIPWETTNFNGERTVKDDVYGKWLNDFQVDTINNKITFNYSKNIYNASRVKYIDYKVYDVLGRPYIDLDVRTDNLSLSTWYISANNSYGRYRYYYAANLSYGTNLRFYLKGKEGTKFTIDYGSNLDQSGTNRRFDIDNWNGGSGWYNYNKSGSHKFTLPSGDDNYIDISYRNNTSTKANVRFGISMDDFSGCFGIGQKADDTNSSIYTYLAPTTSSTAYNQTVDYNYNGDLYMRIVYTNVQKPDEFKNFPEWVKILNTTGVETTGENNYREIITLGLDPNYTGKNRTQRITANALTLLKDYSTNNYNSKSDYVDLTQRYYDPKNNISFEPNSITLNGENHWKQQILVKYPKEFTENGGVFDSFKVGSYTVKLDSETTLSSGRTLTITEGENYVDEVDENIVGKYYNLKGSVTGTTTSTTYTSYVNYSFGGLNADTSSKNFSLYITKPSITLKINPNSLQFIYSGGTDENTTVTSKYITSIDASTSQNWITINPKEITKDGSEDLDYDFEQGFDITTSENTSTSKRSGTITYKYTDIFNTSGSTTQTISQGGKSIVTASPNPLVLQWSDVSGKITLSLTNAVYVRSESSNDWANPVFDSNKTITIYADPNYSEQARDTTITIYYTDDIGIEYSIEVLVIQQGIDYPYIHLIPTQKSIGYEQQTVTVNVQCFNCKYGKYSVAPNDNWATANTKLLDNGDLEIYVTANNTTKARTIYVTIYGVDDNGRDLTSSTFEIYQDVTPTPKITVNPVVINATNTVPSVSTKVTVVDGVFGRAQSNQTWAKPATSLSNGSLVINLEPNTTGKERSASITVYADDLSGTRDRVFVTAVIYQGRAVFDLDNPTRDISYEAQEINARLALTNATFSRAVSNVSWLSVGDYTASNTTLKVNAEQNDGTATRTGTVTLYGNDDLGNVDVYIATLTINQYTKNTKVTIDPPLNTIEWNMTTAQANVVFTQCYFKDVSSNVTWAKPQIIGGQLIVDILENTTYLDRTAIITVNAKGVGDDTIASAIYTLVQKTKPTSVSLNPVSAILKKNETSATTQVTIVNGVYNRAVADDDWVSVTYNSTNRTLTFRCSENPTNDPRTTTIRVYANSNSGVVDAASANFTLTQQGEVSIIITPDRYAAEYTGENHTVNFVATNCTPTVLNKDRTADWVNLVGTIGTNSFEIKIEPNNTQVGREVYLTLSDVENGVTSNRFLLVQNATSFITIVPDTLEFERYGGTRQATLTTINCEYTEYFNLPEWIANVSVQKGENGVNTITFTALANYTGAMREGVVTFHAVDGVDVTREATITLRQTEFMETTGWNVKDVLFTSDAGSANTNATALFIPILTDEVTVSSDTGWCTAEITERSGQNFVIKITVTQNSGEERIAKVTIRGKQTLNSGYISDTFDVIQLSAAQKPTLKWLTNSVVVSNVGGSESVGYVKDDNVTVAAANADNWITVNSLADNVCNFSYNTYDSGRTGTIVLRGTFTYYGATMTIYSDELTVIQSPAPAPIDSVCWDKIVEVTGPYEVTKDGEVIYEGYAYNNGKIKLNEIAENYLSSFIDKLDTGRQLIELENYTGVFEVGNGGIVESSYMHNDWSYDDIAQLGGWAIISDPIKDVVAPNQTFTFSVSPVDNMTSLLFNYSINGSNVYNQTVSDKTFVVFDPSIKNGIVTCCGRSFAVDNNICGRWEVIYQNAMGGYDSFVFNNEVFTRATDITRQFYGRTFDNTISGQRKKTNYMSTLTQKITLNTGLLNNKESEKLYKHLLSSVCIFIRDIDNNKIYPANIVSNNYNEQNYLNGGRKKRGYEITFEMAVPRYRK